MKPAEFDLQGHRGARGLAPENTLTSFARALGLGVTTLELDLALTRDGEVVVSHDPRINGDHTRDAQGQWVAAPGPLIKDLTLAELRRYDVGRLRPWTVYALRFRHQEPKDGERIPTLREVYTLARKAGNAGVRFNVETKIDPTQPGRTVGPEAFAEAVVKVIREEGMAARTTIQSFDWRTLKLSRKLAPEIVTVALTELNTVTPDAAGGFPWLAGLSPVEHGGSIPRTVKAAQVPVWSPDANNLSGAQVQEAHELGLKVIPWTANEPYEMRRLLDMGVDGIISDYPDRLRAVLAERGMPLPPATPVTP